MSDETIKNTFQVASPARLVISNVRGSITIQPGEAGVIEVEAIRHGNLEAGKSMVEMTQDSDGTVRVETRNHESLFGFLSHPPKVDYTVHVPQGIHLEASCISSTLNVSGLEGVFKLKTISGDMSLAKLSGPIKLNAVSGDISGSELTGLLDLGTVSGDVRLMSSSFPTADGSTVSGDLILQTPVLEGPYQFSSVSGSVRMLVPNETHCTIELNSVSGSIRSSLPATATRMGHGLRLTQIGSGGAAIRLKSVSGGVSIEAEGQPATVVSVDSPSTGATASATQPTPPTPPTPPVQPSLSTAEILQRIESGEMTVDEAIKLMKNQP